MKISIPISPGELLDKISILQIKSERIINESKKTNVYFELRLLEKALVEYEVEDTICPKILTELRRELKNVNEKLWVIEDELRIMETKKDFSSKFVDFARSVYKYNDQRASIKRKINDLAGSDLIEEKSYTG